MTSLPPDWPNIAASRFVRAGTLDWHVQVMGEGAPILLLHGTGAATHSWRDVAPRLAGHFQVIACDLPGHGFTRGSVSRPTLPALAKAIGGLVTALAVEPVAIVGHSAGAAVALRMALDGMVKPRAIVALSPALLPFPGIAQHLFPAMARILFVNPFAPHIFAQMARGNGVVERFLERSTGSRIDAAGVAHYAQLFTNPKHCAGALAMMANWDLTALKDDLPRLEPPFLIIHGEKDAAIPIASARGASALVPGASFEMLDSLGHLAHEERPDDVALRIARFVEASVAGSS